MNGVDELTAPGGGGVVPPAGTAAAGATAVGVAVAVCFAQSPRARASMAAWIASG